MRWQLRDPEVRAQGLAGLHVRLQARAVQLALPARAAAPERRARHRRDRRDDAGRASSPPTARCTRSTASSTARASRPTTSCSRWRSRGAGGRLAARRLGRRPARAPRASPCPGFPSMFVMYGPEHEHLGRLDHRLPRGAGRRTSARRSSTCATAAPRRSRCGPRSRRPSDREIQARFAGTAWTRCDSWYRDERGPRSSPTGRATCASTSPARSVFDPSEYVVIDVPERIAA